MPDASDILRMIMKRSLSEGLEPAADKYFGVFFDHVMKHENELKKVLLPIGRKIIGMAELEAFEQIEPEAMVSLIQEQFDKDYDERLMRGRLENEDPNFNNDIEALIASHDASEVAKYIEEAFMTNNKEQER